MSFLQNKIGYEHNKFITLRSSFPSTYYSYFTVYLYGKLDDNKNMTFDQLQKLLDNSHREYCFRRYFTELSGRIKTSKGVGDYVIVRLNMKPLPEQNHFILMSPEQILRFANNFEDMLGYHVEFIDHDGADQSTLYLKIVFPTLSTTGLVERFVLSWIRYIWEVPYSFCAYEALRLFDLNIFPEMDLFNLTDFTMGMVRRIKNASSFNGGHYITKGAGYMSLDKVKEYLMRSTAPDWNGVNNVNSVSKKFFNPGDATIDILSLEDALVDNKFQERIKKHYTELYTQWLGK